MVYKKGQVASFVNHSIVEFGIIKYGIGVLDTGLDLVWSKYQSFCFVIYFDKGLYSCLSEGDKLVLRKGASSGRISSLTLFRSALLVSCSFPTDTVRGCNGMCHFQTWTLNTGLGVDLRY